MSSPAEQGHGLPEPGDAAAVPWPASRELVFDLGAHRGLDTGFYLAKGFRVVAVEANPELARAMEGRFPEAVAEGRLRVEWAAVNDEERPVAFFVNHRHTGMSSLNPYRGKRGGGHRVEVPGVRLRTLLSRHGVPYYLKVDLEGADDMALEDLACAPSLPTWLSTEGGDADTIRLLSSLGYRRFALVDQGRVPRESGRLLESEGRPLRWTFEKGASGPFGMDLEQDWQGMDETMERLQARRARRLGAIEAHSTDLEEALAAARSFSWYDLHAGLPTPG